MARPRLEVATEFLEAIAQASRLGSLAEQHAMMDEEDKIKLADAIIDCQKDIDRLFEEYQDA
jgi:dephospho-CoA kinase